MPILNMSSEVAWDTTNRGMLTNGGHHSGGHHSGGQHQHHHHHHHHNPQQHQHQQQQQHHGGGGGGGGGQDMSGMRQHGMASRSQDDARVGYFFQRPQTDAELANYGNKRWAAGDDSLIEQGRGMTVQDLEREFHAVSLSQREMNAHKKIWDVEDDGKSQEANKGIFSSSPWTPRDNTWSTADHTVSQPLSVVQRRASSFTNNEVNSVLSPRSETNALGVNMVEYVLNSSPTGKDLNPRMNRLKNFSDASMDNSNDKKSKTPSPFEAGDGSDLEKQDALQTNGILQNGLDEDDGYRYCTYFSGSRQNSPIDEVKVNQPTILVDGQKLMKSESDFLEAQHTLAQQGFQIDPNTFEPVAIDPLHFDYPNHLMPSMDSPNFNMDYTQLLQRQQQPIAVLTQQQYALAAQQQQLAITSPSNPYVVNSPAAAAQDPYAAMGFHIAATEGTYAAHRESSGVEHQHFSLQGPAVIHPQYYSVQAPWLYPANLIQQGQQPHPGAAAQSAAAAALSQQQQQQLLRGQSGRPVTPQQQSENIPASALQAQALQTPNAPGYQFLATAYYDQNGQLVMGNPRGIGTPVRLVSPAPVLVNTGNQQGNANSISNNQLRLLTTQAQQAQTPPVIYSSNNSSNSATPQQNNTLGGSGYTPSSTLPGYTQVTSSLFTPISANLGLTPQQQNNYNGPAASLGGSAPGAIGSGLNNQRRDSLDFKRQQPTSVLFNQYYNPIGGMSGAPAGPMGLVQPGQSVTPPPSLSGSTSNLSIGLGNTGRLVSAAPGAETRFRNGPLPPGGGGGGGSGGLLTGGALFNRTHRSASLSKEVSGRSRLLEDFRNNRIPNLLLKDLANHVVEFSQDQHGSRFIQQKLERATPQEKAMVFNEILSAAYSLMTDVFGNYVIQKFFEFGVIEQKQTLAQRVRGHVLSLALQMYGCRVIQKALESIPSDMQVEIVKELDGHVLKCVKDQNGNHVVQKCIECVEPNHLQFIIDAFKGHVFSLSTHPYGCRVIQRILEHCTAEQTTPILEELHEHTERLVQDQYGNYVVQHVLEHGRAEDKSKIVGVIRGKVLDLSQHKFASNVVEKCVSHSSRQERAFLIEEVCSMNDGPHSALYTMMKDQFANYVVQKMIDVAEPAQRKSLMHKIRPHIATLRKYTYGKHILAKLEKFFMKTNSDMPQMNMTQNGPLP
ncbi:pumilio homolog 2 isoform X3 [Octopus sinensis]|uniref:Pumilio homolog 2 isoform X3 n=1 Tax=Octopus sinensis TaxID=2607531 RepID=A0A7E6FL50_9MOLL|nr:pumilio homolog 2 isoform X3 [Octopus sinensis]